MNDLYKNPRDLVDLIDVPRWQKVQDLYAEVTDVGIRTVDEDGKLLSKPSNLPRFCTDVMTMSAVGLERCSHCDSSFANMDINGRRTHYSYPCHAGLRVLVVPITLDCRPVLYVMVGPVLFGAHEQPGRYQKIAEELKLDYEQFMDAIREIKVFSFNKIHAVTQLLKEVMSWVVRLRDENVCLQSSVFQLTLKSCGMGEFIDRIRMSETVDEALETLLEAALVITNAKIGSIMLVDKESKELFIRIARGLRDDVMESNVRLRMGDGVAGIVAMEKRPLLIDDEIADERLKSRLRRPELRSSMVVPLRRRDDVVGVMSIGSSQPDHRFNEENLNVLSRLADYAASAIAEL
jgi:ligand-binding sensor protein